MPKKPSPRIRYPSLKDRRFGELHENVQDALRALPFYFQSDTNITGINAGDIFTLNTQLAATIEEEVVCALNAQRHLWDPHNRYTEYGFVRRPQRFPDVVLAKTKGPISQTAGKIPSLQILLGIELKSYYLLSKEAHPSFRYTVSQHACAEGDLLAVVPWALANVLGGPPRVFTPIIRSAKKAAESRTRYWLTRKTKDGRRGSTKIKFAPRSKIHPYPRRDMKYTDKAVGDGAKNFGRLRGNKQYPGILDVELSAFEEEQLRGVGTALWIAFFKLFADSGDEVTLAEVRQKVENLGKLLPLNDEDGQPADADKMKRLKAEIFQQRRNLAILNARLGNTTPR